MTPVVATTTLLLSLFSPGFSPAPPAQAGTDPEDLEAATSRIVTEALRT